MNGAFVELYNSTVKEQFVNFPKPQSMGNREGVRWCALTDSEGQGALFISAASPSFGFCIAMVCHANGGSSPSLSTS